jgi:hypothetical protein
VTQAAAKAARLGDSPLLKGLGARGAGASVELSAQEVAVRLRVLDDPATPAVPGLGPVRETGLDGMPGDAIAVARVSLDFPALDAVLDQDPRSKDDRERLRAAVKERYGIDLVDDVFHNLDGQFAAAALMPTPAGSSNPDAVVTVGVKDVNRASAALDHLANALTAQGTPLAWATHGIGERWTHAFGFAGGLERGHLFATFGDALGNTVQKGYPPGGIDLLHALPESARLAFHSGPALYAYVDAERLRRFAAANGSDGARAAAALEHVRAVSLGLDARDAILSADLVVYLPSGGADAGSP